MKKTKKLLCIFIAVLMIIPISIVSTLAANTCSCPNAPYVYVVGKTQIYVTREDGSKYAPLDNDKYDVKEISKKVFPLLLDSLKTGDWTEYGNTLYECIAPNFEEIKVNGDGSVAENTGVLNKWSYDTINSKHDASLNYANYYYPDIRVSPMDAADDINEFVKAVKAKTGHSKVNLVGRCLGGCYVMAYLQKYGYDSVNRFELVYATQNGTSSGDAIISGTMSFDSDCLARYVKSRDNLADKVGGSEIMDYLLMTFNMLRETYTDDVCLKIIEKVYEKFKDTTFAALMRDYYGHGGNMAMANEHFDEAIEYIYPTDELKQEYAGSIEKATDYHYNVQLRVPDILKAMDKAGIPVFTFVEYGFQQYPVAGKESAKLSDNTIGVWEQSNGATVSDVNSTLSQEYIDSRVKSGYGDYISPDKQIDASTSVLPDRTWFVKGLKHIYVNLMTEMTNYLMFSDTAPTIHSSEKYPQFMLYTTDESGQEVFVKLDENNSNIIDWDSMENTTGETKRFFNTIINLLKNLFNDLLDKIFVMVDKIKGVQHVKRVIIK